MDLKGTVAVVTGGNGGLGQRICHALAAQGCHIAVVYARSKDQADGVARDLEKHQVGASAFAGAGSIKTNVANATMSWTAGASQTWTAVAVPLHSANPQILFDAASSMAAATNSAANPVNVSWSHVTTTAAKRSRISTR